MRVTIDAGGREVTIETASDQNITYDAVADKALEVWQQTAEAGRDAGPAFGLSSQTREGRGLEPLAAGGNGNWMREVKA